MGGGAKASSEEERRRAWTTTEVRSPDVEAEDDAGADIAVDADVEAESPVPGGGRSADSIRCARSRAALDFFVWREKPLQMSHKSAR